MRCPVDDAQLREVTRQAVKIDLCPECRGVWLDRGELDHLLEASVDVDDDREDRRETGRTLDSRSAPRYDADRGRPLRSRDDDDDDDDDDDRRRRGSAPGNPPAKKRRSWLSDIFEMGE